MPFNWRYTTVKPKGRLRSVSPRKNTSLGTVKENQGKFLSHVIDLSMPKPMLIACSKLKHALDPRFDLNLDLDLDLNLALLQLF